MSWKEQVMIFLLLLAVLVGPAVVPPAPAIDGVPFFHWSITLATPQQSFPSTLCRDRNLATGIERKALMQVKTNSIYYYLDVGGASYPLTTNGALEGNVGDIIEIMFPSKFSAIRQGSTAATNADLSIHCFQ